MCRSKRIHFAPISVMKTVALICASAAVASGLQVGIGPMGQHSTVRMSGVINENIDKEAAKVTTILWRAPNGGVRRRHECSAGQTPRRS